MDPNKVVRVRVRVRVRVSVMDPNKVEPFWLRYGLELYQLP